MIHSQRRGPVAVVTIDRPDRRNAIDTELCGLLADTLGNAAASDARAIVLTGAGGHFCAGADLSTVEDDAFTGTLKRLLRTLLDAPQVAIAAVDGFALGAGTQLAVACDLRVATPATRFGIPAAKLGLMVDHWTVQRLALLAGHGPARAMLLGAEQLGAEDAHRLGLVQRLGGLDDAVRWGEELAALAPLSIAGHKLALNRLEPALDDPEVEAARSRAWASEDVAEGKAAFRERRPPQFQGR